MVNIRHSLHPNFEYKDKIFLDFTVNILSFGQCNNLANRYLSENAPTP